MDARVKALWLSALRSGEYQQGKRGLRSLGGEFCCLGVLCDLHGKETGNKWESVYYIDDDAYLPDDVQDWADLYSEDPSVVSKHGRIDLSEANDAGYTFAEIADLIEANL